MTSIVVGDRRIALVLDRQARGALWEHGYGRPVWHPIT
jgi:hypothetical protein